MHKVVLYLAVSEQTIDRPLSHALRDRAAALYFLEKPYAFIDTAPGEKPALSISTEVCFSATHTKNLYLCAFSPYKPVGVDAEHLRRVPRKERIAKKLFSASALQEYLSAPEEEKETLFLKLWTRHETQGKLLGKGVFFDPDEKGLAAPYFTDLTDDLPEGFFGTLCTPCPAEIEWRKLAEE